MKKLWVGTSWKMNKDTQSTKDWISSVLPHLEKLSKQVQPFVIPPFPYLSLVADCTEKQAILVGAQNICWQEKGAFTGEVSPLMVKDCGASIVEIGHSERREWFGDSDKTVNLKVLAALRNGLTPLVCVGDSAEEKRWGVSLETVVRQIKIALFQVPTEDLGKVIIAYEPVWAIGENGTPASAEEAQCMHQGIRRALADRFGPSVSQEITLLYGGSVNLNNAATLMAQTDIDGVFVGRTAWEADGYVELLNIAQMHIEE